MLAKPVARDYSRLTFIQCLKDKLASRTESIEKRYYKPVNRGEVFSLRRLKVSKGLFN